MRETRSSGNSIPPSVRRATGSKCHESLNSISTMVLGRSQSANHWLANSCAYHLVGRIRCHPAGAWKSRRPANPGLTPDSRPGLHAGAPSGGSKSAPVSPPPGARRCGSDSRGGEGREWRPGPISKSANHRLANCRRPMARAEHPRPRISAWHPRRRYCHWLIFTASDEDFDLVPT